MSKSILVVAAHPDDEVLGCGGTIAKHVSSGDTVTCVFMTNGESSRDEEFHEIETRKKSAVKASQILGCQNPIFFDFPDNKLDTVPILDLAKALESVSNGLNPQIIYSHSASDLNVDHRRVLEAVLVSFRPQPNSECQAIYSFEILSATNWAPKINPHFVPNYFVDIDHYFDKKMEALQQYIKEMHPPPHSRSVQNVEVRSKYLGSLVGLNKSEAFEILRKIDK